MSEMSADAYTFGIEEEFFLVDRRTRNAVPRVSKRFVEACRKRLGEQVTYELQQTQVEIVSPILSSTPQALQEMTRLRSGVADVARTFDLGIIAAGTHPLAAWRRQQHTEKPRYARIMEAFRIVGQRDVLCGLHIHVAVPTGDRVALMNRLMPWLPLFLALSTSSPFWSRRNTGLLSYRQSAYDEWPRTGIPDFFEDERDYAAFVDRLARARALEDGSELWWAIRPSPRFPTLELRIADSCSRVQDSVALATLFRCLVRAHVRRPELGAQRSNATRRFIEENRWRAKRDGAAAEFIDEIGDRSVSVAQLLGELSELLAPDIKAFDAHDTMDTLRAILAHGSSAHEQLAQYHASRAAGGDNLTALRATVDWLLETTSPGQSVAQ